MGKNYMKSRPPKKDGHYKQGYYTPINPEKYGDPDPRIIYRSGLERKFCVYCDTNPNIIKWASEPIGIPYIDPVNGKRRTYYPDYLIIILTGDGTKHKVMVEVKASNMLKMPKQPSKYANKKKKRLYESLKIRVIRNLTKYQFAKEFCKARGMTYTFLTEKFFDG